MQPTPLKVLIGIVCAALVASLTAFGVTHRVVMAAGSDSWTYSTHKLPVRSDTTVWRERPRTSAGSRDKLVVRDTPGYHKRTYLKFVVPAKLFTGDGEVASAVLQLTSADGTRATVVVRPVPNTGWTERALSFATAPRSAAPDTAMTTTANGVSTVDLTAYVRKPGSYAFELTTKGDIGRFRSSESGRHAPVLTLRVRKPKVDAPAPAPTPSATATPKPSPKPSSSPTGGPPTSPAPKPTPKPTSTPDPTKPAPSPTAGCHASFPGDPCDGTLYYGASVEGGDPASLENQIGHRLALFRAYMQGASAADKFGRTAAQAVDNGRIPLISTKVPGTWAEVANGQYDSWLVDRIKSMATAKGPVWLALHHEPTNDGDPADWVRMQQHARTLIKANSTNIALVGILNGWEFRKKNADPEVWDMPVGTGVDVMGFDSYNPWSTTNGKNWISASEAFSPATTIASWGYPTLIGEYGVRNDPSQPGKAAQWMRDAYSYAVAHHFVGMSYFDSGANSPDGTWELDGERVQPFIDNLTSASTARL